MFEAVVVNVLNKFLGDYVENFQSNQLNIAIWNGDIKLKNLRLKKDALDKLKLPMNFKEGYMGELTMKIPWHNLKNLPVAVTIDNVYLLISPKDAIELDAKEEEEKSQRLKQEKLETYELMKTKKLHSDEEDMKQASFTTQLVTKIVDNLQVSIHNIHLRYEDTISNPGHPFSIGVTLNEVSALSTNENWQEAIIDEASKVIHKLLRLKSLGVYWNTDSDSLAGNSVEGAIEAFMKLIPSEKNQPDNIQFILEPVSAIGKLIVNNDFLVGEPKNTTGLEFDQFNLVLDDEQYRDLMLATSMFDLVMRKQKYIKYHPPVGFSYSEKPLDWFRFSARCILTEVHEKRRQWTWEYFKERRDDRISYLDLYTKLKINTITEDEKAILELLERKLKFRDIKFYRTLAQPEINRQRALIQKEEEGKQQPSWIGSLLGWSGGSTEDKDEGLLTDDQMKRLYETIDYDEDSALQAADLPREFISLALKAQLKKGSLTLKKDPHGALSDIISLDMKDFEVDFVQRIDSFKANFSLNELELLDGTNPESIYPRLIKVSDIAPTSDITEVEDHGDNVSSTRTINPFFKLEYEHNPLDEKSDDSLSLKMRNLEIIYNTQTINTVVSFFKPPTRAQDSVSALIEAAGSKFEGLKKQTTASLQYALEEHRTLDILVDIQAPLIIIPHSFTDKDAQVVVLDSGHIVIDSESVDKLKKEEMQKKQREDFTENDFKELESLMYDKLNLELTSVQLVVGNSLDRCLEAVSPSSPVTELHVVDRINMKFSILISILPQVSHLTKIRLQGHLPLLQVNFSDHKYKTLMSTLDLVLASNADSLNGENQAGAKPSLSKQKSFAQLTSPAGIAEYVLYDDEAELLRKSSSDAGPELIEDDEDEFFDAEDNREEIQAKYQNLDQKLFVLEFTIDKLKASIRKVQDNHTEDELADAHLDGFSLHVVQFPYHMEVDIAIKKLNVFDKLNPDHQFFHLITSEDVHNNTADQELKNLVQIAYIRANPESPEYLTRFEGINQKLDVSFSTLNVIVTQKSILSLYNFILITFTSNGPSANASSNNDVSISSQDSKANPEPSKEVPASTLLVKMRMDSLNLILNDDGQILSTISLVDGDLTVLMTQSSLRLSTKLNNLFIIDNTSGPDSILKDSEYKLLSIESEEVVEIRYESFNNKSVDLGYDSLIHVNLGAARLFFVENQLSRLLSYFSRFAEMHLLFETARQAAMNSASQLQEQVNRLKFDIKMKSPKIIFPKNVGSTDCITANLGELYISNSFTNNENFTSGQQMLNNIKLELQSIFLSSSIHFPDFTQSLQIIENIDIDLKVVITEHVAGSSQPEKELIGSMSPVSLKLTQKQYGLLLDVFQSILRTINGDQTQANSSVDAEQLQIKDLEGNIIVGATTNTKDNGSPSPTSNTSESEVYSTLDAVFTLENVHLDLFNGEDPDKLFEHRLAQLSLNNTNVKYLIQSDGITEMEAEIHSFVVLDSRTDFDYSFREIIPAITHEGPQFMAHMSTKPNLPSTMHITVDSPKFVLAVDYLLAMKKFALSPFEKKTPEDPDLAFKDTELSLFEDPNSKSAKTQPDTPSQSVMNYRLNVVDAEVIVLADVRNPASEAIVLSIQQVVISQQGILSLAIDKVGMHLCQMNHREQTALRFIENFDIILSMNELASNPAHNLTDIFIDVKPLIFRLSYRDVMLITDVINKFSQVLYADASTPSDDGDSKRDSKVPASKANDNRLSTVSTLVSKTSKPTPYQIVSRETLKLTIQGLQIILIRDAYDLPIIDINTDPFTINVSDWSGHLKADLQVFLTTNFFNIKNSHWEPLIEPWSFSLAVSRPNGSLKVDFQSKRLLDLNMTPAIIETLMSFSEEIQKHNPLSTPRGNHIPYIIWNRTGYAMHIWPDSGNGSEEVSLSRIEDGEDLPWRFDDWRKTRESVTQSRNSLGLQIENVTWESLKDILVDQEGVTTYLLRPLLMGVSHRLVCDVQLKDNVKIVTFRSPLSVVNCSLIPMELVVVDVNRNHLSRVKIIPPGEQCSVPIESAYRFGLQIRPSSGFGYNWSSSYIYWREFLIDSHLSALECPANNPEDPPFHIQVDGKFNVKDPILTNYPCITFRLSAPLELENLLPYDIRFTFYDSSNNEWPSFLKRGGVSPIHMIDTTTQLEFSMEIWDKDYKPSQRIAISHPSRSYDNLKIITLQDSNGLELNLRAQIIPTPDSGGSFKLSIFSPYVLLNKTGLDMFFKTQSLTRQTKIASGQDNANSDKILPFMFSYGRNETRKRALVKIGQSEWSHPVSFEASGSVSELVLKSTSRPEQINLGVSIEDGVGKFHATRLVTFTPRFIVKNNLDTSINFREFTGTSSSVVQPKERTPLYFISQMEDKMMTLCFPGINNLWSSPFKIDTVGKVHVQLTKASGAIELIKVDIQLQGATIFIFLEKETNKWPFRIENMTESDIVFYQNNSDRGVFGYKEPPRYKLASGKAVPYSWDFPSNDEKGLTIAVKNHVRTIDFQQIGALMPFRYHTENGMKVMSIDVIAEGPTQVLRLSKYVEAESLYRPTRTFSNTSILSRSQTQTPSRPSTSSSGNGSVGSNSGFEIVEQDSKILFGFSVKLEGIGISLVNRRKQELLYATLKDVEFKFNDYNDSQSINMKIKWIQIDNQLFGSVYPILLFPTVISKTGNESNLHPTLQVVATRSKDPSHGVESYKYFTFLLQEMSFEIDEDFLFSLLDFVKYSLPSAIEPEEDKTAYIHQSMEVPEPTPISDDIQVYFSLLHIQPLKLNLSFMRTEHINQEEVEPASNNPLTFVINVLTMAIGSINDAPIKFNSLVLENLLADYSVLMDRLTSYYGQEFVYQIHKIVGSADVIGNPVGLFNNLSSGVVDIFYEPYQGFVMSDRPQDFGIGLARGTASFVKKTVFGLSDSFSKITESLGKGLAEVTMDKQFIDRRRLSKSRNRPKHALYGVAKGANSLGSSVASGISGVVLQPLEGAERDGVSGFFRGVGKGLVGVVTKPVVGAFDLVSNVAEGIRNTTTVFDTDQIDRVRLPRYVAPDGILRPYSQREALGQKWLQEFKDGKYYHEHYLAHYDLRNSQTIVMLTSNRIMQIKLRTLNLDWEMPFSDLQSVRIDPSGIAFVTHHGTLGPFVPISEPTSRAWFGARIDEAFDHYLSFRRPLE